MKCFKESGTAKTRLSVTQVLFRGYCWVKYMPEIEGEGKS